MKKNDPFFDSSHFKILKALLKFKVSVSYNGLISATELAYFLLTEESQLFTKSNFRKLVSRGLEFLCDRGLVKKVSILNVKNLVLPDKRIRFLYLLTSKGEELLRFLYPCNLEMSGEYFPVRINFAKNFLAECLSKKGLSFSRIRRICLTQKYGREEFVFKKESPEKLREKFPYFPFVSQKEIFDKVFDIYHTPLTQHLITLVKTLFNSRDAIPYGEFIGCFLGDLKK
jgi:hypothetical protein